MALRDAVVLTRPLAARLGMLKPFSGVRLFDVGISVGVERLSEKAIKLYLPRDATLSLRFPFWDEQAWRSLELGLTSVDLKFGKRECFVCPVSGKKCYKIFLYKDIASSRECFSGAIALKRYSSLKAEDIETRMRLVGNAGMRFSTKSRSRYLQKAVSLEGKDEGVDQKLREERAREKKYQKRWLWESRPLSTTKAVECGRWLTDTDQLRVMQDRPGDWFDDVSPGIVMTPARSQQLVTDFGELDIRILIGLRMFSEEVITGKTIGWPPEAIGGHYLSMFIRPRESDLPQMMIEVDNAENQISYQDIRLLSHPDSDRPRHFRCPITLKRTDVLYFRNGFFASRAGHLLRYPPGGKAGVIRDIRHEVAILSPSARRR